MGRHSATPRDRRPQRRRLARNALSVLVVTLATMTVVLVSISLHAAAKDREIPLPTMAMDASGAYVAIPQAHAETGPIPEPTLIDGGGTGATQRVCPVTGCAAPTCHAETGEPTPHR